MAKPVLSAWGIFKPGFYFKNYYKLYFFYMQCLLVWILVWYPVTPIFLLFLFGCYSSAHPFVFRLSELLYLRWYLLHTTKSWVLLYKISCFIKYTFKPLLFCLQAMRWKNLWESGDYQFCTGGRTLYPTTSHCFFP